MPEIKILDDKYIKEHEFTRDDLDKYAREHSLMKNHNMETSTNLENIIRIKCKQHNDNMHKIIDMILGTDVLKIKVTSDKDTQSQYQAMNDSLEKAYEQFNAYNENFFIYDEYANKLELKDFGMWTLLVKQVSYIQDLFNMSFDIVRYAIKLND